MNFRCETQRVETYEIEFDTDIINEKWMEEFRDFFFDYYTLEEHAQHIAEHRIRIGNGFIEGYGIPLENGEVPPFVKDNEVNHAINIKTIGTSDTYTDVYEINK